MLFRIRELFFLFAMVLCFASCEVEFNPNEQWQPTTIIYGVLDQDSDTTFVRIQKGFLGNGNYLDFAKERDSIYYKQEDLNVYMVSYYPWDTQTICDTFHFNYTEITSKEEGDFYSESTPLYYCVTKGRMNYDEALKREYKIIVKNNNTGEETSATTRLIGDYDITSPGHIMSFLHKNGKDIMSCSWYNINSFAMSNHMGTIGKVYQPMMRFYYRANGVETHTDIYFGTKINVSEYAGFEFKYNMEMSDVVNGIRKNLEKDRGNCSWTNRTNAFELYIHSCTLEMYEYYSNSLHSGSALSDKPIYTNVNNGYGLFAAQRKQIKIVFTVDDNKLLNAIKALNLGF
ncbi:MAG: hypothetical protein J6P97_02175 [Bacteroidales bacterium]|jgi:hypothetical protein|nr:hypothetical protein [Bacteroidales bacterium]